MKPIHLFKTMLGAVALSASMTAAAQSNTISFLVGFPPGGSTDTIARVLADQVSKELNRTIVVENRPGAGGRVGATALINSKADGNTYLVMPNAVAIFNHLVYGPEKLGYDVVKDMEPVAVLTEGPIGLAVNANLGVNNITEYVEWLRKSGQPGFFGSAGQGGQTHFSGLAFGNAAGVEMSVVPYRGNGPMLTDLIGGQVPAAVSVVGDLLPHVESGKVKLLAIFGEERSDLVPDVPTLKEAGVDVVAGAAWTGIWTKKGAPEAEVQKMEDAIRKVLQRPEVQEQFRRANLLTTDIPGDRMAGMLDQEMAFWKPVIERSGFTPEQ